MKVDICRAYDSTRWDFLLIAHKVYGWIKELS